MARLNAAPFPRLWSLVSKRITPGCFAATASTWHTDPSVEPSSETIISRAIFAGNGAAMTRSSNGPTKSSSLKSGTRTDSFITPPPVSSCRCGCHQSVAASRLRRRDGRLRTVPCPHLELKEVEQLARDIDRSVSVSFQISSNHVGLVDTPLPQFARAQQVVHRAVERVPKPGFGRSWESHLIEPASNRFGNAVAHRRPQNVFVPGTAHLPLLRQAEGQRYEATIEEGHAGLDRMRHRVPILESEVIRKRCCLDGVVQDRIRGHLARTPDVALKVRYQIRCEPRTVSPLTRALPAGKLTSSGYAADRRSHLGREDFAEIPARTPAVRRVIGSHLAPRPREAAGLHQPAPVVVGEVRIPEELIGPSSVQDHLHATGRSEAAQLEGNHSHHRMDRLVLKPQHSFEALP